MGNTWHAITCAALLAVHHANTRDPAVVPKFAALPDDFHLNISLADSGSTAPGGVTAYRALSARGVHGFVGPWRSAVCAPTGILSGVDGLPMVTYGAAASFLTDPNEYPTFTRVNPDAGLIAKSALGLMHHFGWRVYATLFQMEPFAEDFVVQLREQNDHKRDPQLVRAEGFTYSDANCRHPANGECTMDIACKNLKASGAHVFVVIIFGNQLKDLLAAADRHGLIGPDYVWMYVSSSVHSSRANGDPDLTRRMTGHIAIHGGSPRNADGFARFESAWLTDAQAACGAADELWGGPPDASIFDVPPTSNSAAYAYDAVAALALAVGRTPNASSDARAIIGSLLIEDVSDTSEFEDKSFDGAGGIIANVQGKRVGTTFEAQILNYVPNANGELEELEVGRGFRLASSNESERLFDIPDAKIVWGCEAWGVSSAAGGATVCLANTTANPTGDLECQAGQYFNSDEAPSNDDLDCLQCKSPTSSNAGATSCDLCILHHFLFDGACLQCEHFSPGLDCRCGGGTEGICGVTLATVPLFPGFWRASPNTTEVFACDGGACLGGNDTLAYCAEPYEGPLCERCAEGYWLGEGQRCRQCPGNGGASMLLSLGLAVGLGSFLAVLSSVADHAFSRLITVLRKTPQGQVWSAALLRLVRVGRWRLSMLQPAIYAKVFLAFGQVVSSIPDTVSVHLLAGEGLGELARGLIDGVKGLVSVDFLNVAVPVECAGDFTTRLVQRAIFPLVLIALCFGVSAARAVLRDDGDDARSSRGHPAAAPPPKLSMAPVTEAVEDGADSVKSTGSGGGRGGALASDLRVAPASPLTWHLPRVAFERATARRAYLGALSAMPLALAILFFFVPDVSQAIFEAFGCERFETASTRRYLDSEPASFEYVLKADTAIRCGTLEVGYPYVQSPQYAALTLVALVLVLIWPMGVPLTFAWLLRASHSAVRSGRPTSLSRAVGFLMADYRADYFFWEVPETARKLLLTGFILLLPSHLVFVRLVSAVLVALGFLVALVWCKPYAKVAHNAFAVGCQAMLVMLYTLAIIAKLTAELKSYGRETLTVLLFGELTSIGLALPLFVAYLVVFATLAVIVGVELCAQPTSSVLRLVSTGRVPDTTLAEGTAFHCTVVATALGCELGAQLQLRLPGVAVFDTSTLLRDADGSGGGGTQGGGGGGGGGADGGDGGDGGAVGGSGSSDAELASKLSSSATCVVCLSRELFFHQASLSEVQLAVRLGLPLVRVLDQRDGSSLSALRAICPLDLQPLLFDSKEAQAQTITWPASHAAQLIALALVAEAVLRVASPPLAVDEGAPPAAAATEEEIGALSALCAVDMLYAHVLRFPKPVVLLTSPWNAGAHVVAQSLADRFPETVSCVAEEEAAMALASTAHHRSRRSTRLMSSVRRPSKLVREAAASIPRRVQSVRDSRAISRVSVAVRASRRETVEAAAGDGGAERRAHPAPMRNVSQDASALPWEPAAAGAPPTHMMLYLNPSTWRVTAEALAADVRRGVLKGGLPLILVHEASRVHGTCALADLIACTADDLVRGGVYAGTPVPWLTDQHEGQAHRYRECSLTQLALALGARRVGPLDGECDAAAHAPGAWFEAATRGSPATAECGGRMATAIARTVGFCGEICGWCVRALRPQPRARALMRELDTYKVEGEPGGQRRATCAL